MVCVSREAKILHSVMPDLHERLCPIYKSRRRRKSTNHSERMTDLRCATYVNRAYVNRLMYVRRALIRCCERQSNVRKGDFYLYLLQSFFLEIEREREREREK